MGSNPASPAKPPFGPPDCPWKKVSSDSSIPKRAVYKDGKLDGNKVYIGRVYDDKSWLIGTVLPEKGICIYLDKDSEVKSSANYEILTLDCDCVDPLCFNDMDLDNKNIFKAGIDESGEILYVGCYADSDGNTYYGWATKSDRSVHIPRDSSLGPQVLKENYGVMIHKFLDRLCICASSGPCCKP